MNWLFLRGLARDSRHWHDFPGIFSEIVPNARVHTLDVPGAGTEHKRWSSPKIEDLTNDLRLRWLALPKGDWCCLSNSMGGMILLDWLSRYPGSRTAFSSSPDQKKPDSDFKLGVLINSSAGGISTLLERITPAGLAFFGRTLATRNVLERERGVVNFVTATHSGDEPLAQEWRKFENEYPVNPLNILSQISAAARFKAPPAHSIKVPLLILSSAGDRLVQPTCSAAISQRYKAAHKVHSSGGHDLTVDDPRWVAEQVRDWIGANQTS